MSRHRDVTLGKAFLLYAGDSAELFDYCEEDATTGHKSRFDSNIMRMITSPLQNSSAAGVGTAIYSVVSKTLRGRYSSSRGSLK
jgi:hypothetical protein